ncbi:MAG: BLUF domain-containing protein [Bryobacteraceae bacterium]
MTSDLYQILYCSRNCMHGGTPQTALEINNILSASRRNNVKLNVTGALLFNTVFFAQVLEGPLSGVEKIFEQIQRDLRHSDLIVLDSGVIEVRNFPVWSMAFAGADAEAPDPFIAATLNAAVSAPSAAGKDVLSMLRNLVLQEDAWALPSRRSSAI